MSQPDSIFLPPTERFRMRKKVKRKFVIVSNISDHCGDQVCNVNWFKFMCEMKFLCGLFVRCSQRAVDNVAHDCQMSWDSLVLKTAVDRKKLINENSNFIRTVNKTRIYEEKILLSNCLNKTSKARKNKKMSKR